MIPVIKQLTGNTRYVTIGQEIATNLAIKVIQTYFRGDSKVIPGCLKSNSELGDSKAITRWLERNSEVTQMQFWGFLSS